MSPENDTPQHDDEADDDYENSFRHWQALEDLKFRASLVQCRIAAGLTIENLAKASGFSEEFIRRIEDFDHDPHLSTLRRYAAMVGAVVHHSVQPLPANESEEEPK